MPRHSKGLLHQDFLQGAGSLSSIPPLGCPRLLPAPLILRTDILGIMKRLKKEVSMLLLPLSASKSLGYMLTV
jgi:hypothetical protein